MNMFEDKCYFVPGDKVRNNKLVDAPEMYVIRKKELTLKDGDNNLKRYFGSINYINNKLYYFKRITNERSRTVA